MANVFTASGNVIPGTGNITFNSNAASNAVRQVFGEGTSNMQGLSGSNYNTSTRPPGYTPVGTVPTAASGNLKLSFFAGKSIYLTAPSSLTITTPMTVPSSLTTIVSGGGGASFYVMVGTTSTGTNILSNVSAGVAAVTIASNTNYYISAYGSNAAGASSLLVSNTTPFVSSVPPTPTGVSFTATTTAMTPTFTASLGNATTTYRGKIGTTSGGVELGNAVAVTSGSANTISVASNTFVYLTIAGSNSLGLGPYSGVVGPITSSIPSAPTGLSLTLNSLSNYSGGWTTPIGNASTSGTWAITGTGLSGVNGTISTTGSLAQSTGTLTTQALTNGATYTLTVQSSNAKGLGASATTTATAAFTRVVSYTPSPPVLYIVRSGGGIGSTAITVNTANPSVNTYTVTIVAYVTAGSTMHFTHDVNDRGGTFGSGMERVTVDGNNITSSAGGGYLYAGSPYNTGSYSAATSKNYTIVISADGGLGYDADAGTTTYLEANGVATALY